MYFALLCTVRLEMLEFAYLYAFVYLVVHMEKLCVEWVLRLLLALGGGGGGGEEEAG